MRLWPKWYKPMQRSIVAVDVIDAVSRHYGVTREQIKGQGRGAELVDARWVVAKALERSGKPYAMIGRILNRDHTSIIHACRSFSTRAAHRPDMIACLNGVV